MNIIEDANLLVSNNAVKEDSESFINDIIEGVLGNPWALAKVMIAIANSPFYIREQLFWSKLDTFLNGIYLKRVTVPFCEPSSRKTATPTKTHYA